MRAPKNAALNTFGINPPMNSRGCLRRSRDEGYFTISAATFAPARYFPQLFVSFELSLQLCDVVVQEAKVNLLGHRYRQGINRTLELRQLNGSSARIAFVFHLPVLTPRLQLWIRWEWSD